MLSLMLCISCGGSSLRIVGRSRRPYALGLFDSGAGGRAYVQSHHAGIDGGEKILSHDLP